MILIKTMKSMKEMKIDFPVYILHALDVLHGKIKYSMLNFMTLMPHLRERFISHPLVSHKSFEQLFKSAGIKGHKNGTPMGAVHGIFTCKQLFHKRCHFF